MEKRSQGQSLKSFTCMLWWSVVAGASYASPQIGGVQQYPEAPIYPQWWQSNMQQYPEVPVYPQWWQNVETQDTLSQQRPLDKVSKLVDTIGKWDKTISDGLNDLSKAIDRKARSDDDLAVLKTFSKVLRRQTIVEVDKSTRSKILQVFHLKRYSSWERPNQILEKIVDILIRKNGSKSSETFSWMRDFLHAYAPEGILTRECIQSLIKDPDKTTVRLASKLQQSVCCLVVHSGFFAFPNFFPRAYWAHYDAKKEKCTQEVIEAGLVSDQSVVNAMDEKGILKQLRNGKTLLFIADKDLDVVYLILYHS